MHRKEKVIVSVLCALLIATVISGTAAAVSGPTTTNLPAGILIGDQTGIYADKSGYYYIDVRGIHPGDVIHKTITLQNMEQNDGTPEGKVPYTLTMTAEPLFATGPQDLLNMTHCVMKLDGHVVYDGTCRGDGNPNMINTALQLGDYAVGDRRILDITLTVSPDLQLFQEKSEADFRWHFYAYRALNPEPPKTGLLDNYGYTLPIGGMVLFSAILIPMKKRRDERIRAAAGENESV